MKATAKNFTTLPANQIPTKLKEIHKDLTGIAQFYGQDKDITSTIDSYVSKLNSTAGKAKTTRKVQPAPKAGTVKKATAKKAVSKAKKTPEQKAKAAAKLTQMRTDGVGGKYAKMTRNQVLATAQAYNATRTLGAIMVDGGVDHKKRLSPTPENLVRWMKAPGKFDLIGVDNFKENDPTADLKIKKEIFWGRLGLGRKRK